KAVDVLGGEREGVAEALLQFGKSEMARVWLHLADVFPPCVVKAPDEFGIAAEAFGRGDIFDAVPFPQTVRRAKGRHTALGRDAGPGQHCDLLRFRQLRGSALDRFVEILNWRVHRLSPLMPVFHVCRFGICYISSKHLVSGLVCRGWVRCSSVS